MPKIIVFDTETTSVEKPFCYNIGYVICDTDTKQILVKKDYVVEQIWHNIALFSTAYYAEKRPLYVSRMRGRTCKMEKFGYITQEMYRLIKLHNVEFGFAYNSSFDVKVFDFNCDFFKCINPIESIPILDIRAYVHKVLAFCKDYQNFCEKHKLFTESGNYSTTAESVYKYLTDNAEFIEEHTALADSEIELDILLKCCELGCKIGCAYKTYRSIPRAVTRTLKVYQKLSDNSQVLTEFDFKSMTMSKDRQTIRLKVQELRKGGQGNTKRDFDR